jgi:large subunit ribosomal protein L2
MAVKKYKPITPGMRDMTGHTFEEITKSTPERSLLVIKKRSGGRNAYGRVTVRHRGGGARRYIRMVDFKREKYGIPAKVAAIEYDPNRTARLALLELCRRRKTLHHLPLGPESWRHRHVWSYR